LALLFSVKERNEADEDERVEKESVARVGNKIASEDYTLLQKFKSGEI
jgi:hypothetical protein